MCVGLACLLGPPSVAGVCYCTWYGGQNLVTQQLEMDPPSISMASAAVGVGALYASYKAQKVLVIRHFDEGGFLSYGYKPGVESLGEPLKIKTWGQFYKAAGPPVFARTGAVIVSFFFAGAAQTLAAYQSRTK